MSTNPIPKELKSDHLFLLVGTNPLPDWVATRLLLKNDGQLYLVHSDQTAEVATRLARYLMDQGCRQPAYVEVKSAYKASEVYNSILEKLKPIKSGSIGLNYTGGTKVMAVHGYRSIENESPPGLPPLVFSYLEAARCAMQFEGDPRYPDGRDFRIGMVDELRISLTDLFRLHENFLVEVADKTVNAEPIAVLLAEVHSKKTGQEAWRSCVYKLPIKYPPSTGDPKKRVNQIISEEELRSVRLTLYPQFTHIADALVENGSAGNTTFGEIVDNGKWGFSSATELAEWLDGKWLEHYALLQFINHAEEYGVYDYGRNIKPALKQTDFEADIGAIRGYQLHLISCYSGSDKKESKKKLFEVFTRVRQLGGDETRAAVVCCSDDPHKVRPPDIPPKFLGICAYFRT